MAIGDHTRFDLFHHLARLAFLAMDHQPARALGQEAPQVKDEEAEDGAAAEGQTPTPVRAEQRRVE